MGYYTLYSLSVSDLDKQAEDGNVRDLAMLTNELNEISEECFEVRLNGLSQTDTKWHGRQEDMRELSRRHPAVLFKLSGRGEDRGDDWVEYYQAGKMQRAEAEIVYEDFDPEKLE